MSTKFKAGDVVYQWKLDWIDDEVEYFLMNQQEHDEQLKEPVDEEATYIGSFQIIEDNT